MLYTICRREYHKDILENNEECLYKGDLVWKSLSEVQAWAKENTSSSGIYVVFADWDEDTIVVSGESYRKLNGVFKVDRLEAVFPDWLIEAAHDIADEAWGSSILDEGFMTLSQKTPLPCAGG